MRVLVGILMLWATIGAARASVFASGLDAMVWAARVQAGKVTHIMVFIRRSEAFERGILLPLQGGGIASLVTAADLSQYRRGGPLASPRVIESSDMFAGTMNFFDKGVVPASTAVNTRWTKDLRELLAALGTNSEVEGDTLRQAIAILNARPGDLTVALRKVARELDDEHADRRADPNLTLKDLFWETLWQLEKSGRSPDSSGWDLSGSLKEMGLTAAEAEYAIAGLSALVVSYALKTYVDPQTFEAFFFDRIDFRPDADRVPTPQPGGRPVAITQFGEGFRVVASLRYAWGMVEAQRRRLSQAQRDGTILAQREAELLDGRMTREAVDRMRRGSNAGRPGATAVEQLREKVMEIERGLLADAQLRDAFEAAASVPVRPMVYRKRTPRPPPAMGLEPEPEVEPHPVSEAEAATDESARAATDEGDLADEEELRQADHFLKGLRAALRHQRHLLAEEVSRLRRWLTEVEPVLAFRMSQGCRECSGYHSAGKSSGRCLLKVASMLPARDGGRVHIDLAEVAKREAAHSRRGHMPTPPRVPPPRLGR